MDRKFPFPCLALFALFVGILGCASGPTRGYSIEPAGEVVRIPIGVRAVEGREGSLRFLVWSLGFQEVGKQWMTRFFVRVDGEGYTPVLGAFRMVVDTGRCPEVEGSMVVAPFEPPSEAARISALQGRIDSLRSLPEPEPHWSQKLFRFLALFAGPSGGDAAEEDRKEDREYLDHWRARRDREIAGIQFQKESLAAEAEALRYERPPVGPGRFQSALRFPWHPRTCRLEIQLQGKDSLLRFPFRPVQD